LEANISVDPFWASKQKYVLATEDGEKYMYPPRTYLLLCGLQRYMKEKKYAFNIMDRESSGV